MEIGKLNQCITILEQSTKIDNIGNHKAQWEEVVSLWAAVSVKKSSESTEAGVTREIITVEFTVRQTPMTLHLNATTHRILFRGQMYNIDSVQPTYTFNDYLKITAITRKAGDADDFCG